MRTFFFGQLKLQDSGSGGNDGALDDVLQLPDVAGPVVVLEHQDMSPLERDLRNTQSPAGLAQEVRGQQRAVPCGWDSYRRRRWYHGLGETTRVRMMRVRRHNNDGPRSRRIPGGR
ncbi:MAG: hypothetical protein IH935_08645 [Acidobacteria bacterium]|nr:hypothetical protein [Acidobacteriota bacterium]